MNRRERRRAAKLRDIVEIKLGRIAFDIKPGDDVSRDICFVCGKPATAWLAPKVAQGRSPKGARPTASPVSTGKSCCCVRTASTLRRRPAARSYASTGMRQI
jgi:hypothetical protein